MLLSTLAVCLTEQVQSRDEKEIHSNEYVGRKDLRRIVMDEKKCSCTEHKLKVINIGIPRFYDALVAQNVKSTQLDWRPPFKQSEEIQNLLDMFM